MSYGPTDARPTPILVRRHFTIPHHAIKELRDEALKLSLGKAGFSPKRATAALEGYVAAIEVR